MKVKWVPSTRGNPKAVFEHRAYVRDKPSKKNKRGKKLFHYQCAYKTQCNCNARVTIGNISIFKIAHYPKSLFFVQKPIGDIF